MPIPGPRAPALAQTAEWIARPVPFLERCARRYGDRFTLRLAGLGEIVFLSRPDDIRRVFTAGPDELHAGKANAVLRPLLGDYSVLLLDGADHLRQRRLLLPPFHGERMQAYAEAMRDITQASVERWPVGRPFALHPFMQDITLRVILRTVFGVDDARDRGDLRRVLADLLDDAARPSRMIFILTQIDVFRLAPWSSTARKKRAMDVAVRAEIDRRRREPTAGRSDVLSLMLDARDEEGRAMTDVELHDELVTLLLAGHETTATSLAWTFEQVLSSPDIVSRIRAELDEVVGEGNLSAQHLAQLPYLEAVTREALRLRPIIPVVARVAQRPFALSDVTFPVGTRFAPCILLTHRRPDLYPEPHAFRPERFLGTKPDPYAWLPFGGGIRRCLGMAFALYEMKVVLATVFHRATMRLSEGKPARVVRRGITFAPAGGTRVIRDAA